MKTKTPFRISLMAFCLSALLFPTLMYAQGSWQDASSDGFTPRDFAAASEVGGKIYVMGGFGRGYGGAGSNALNILEVFDPSSDSWSTPTTTGGFTERYGLSSAVVDGKIYVMGGLTEPSDSSTVNLLEVFDPQSNVWSKPTTTGISTKRYGFTSAVINGKIYVIGGKGKAADVGYVTTVEVFDPSTNQWSTPVTIGTFTGRVYFTSSVVGNKIYTFGGRNGMDILNTLEVFDPLTNSWSTPSTTGTSTARTAAASGVLDGKMYVIGGYDSFTTGGNYLGTVEVFDPLTNTWTTPIINGYFTARFGCNALAVDGKIYAMGGANGVALNTNEVFTPAGSSVKADAVTREFTLSPNPTSGIVTVYCATTATYHVTITNLLGMSVMDLDEPEASDFMIDLSKLTSGAYILKLSGGGSVTTRMIVRQ